MMVTLNDIRCAPATSNHKDTMPPDTNNQTKQTFEIEIDVDAELIQVKADFIKVENGVLFLIEKNGSKNVAVASFTQWLNVYRMDVGKRIVLDKTV